MASNGRINVNIEFRRMWKEAVVGYFKVLPSVCLEGMRKTTESLVRIAGNQATIQNGYL